MTGPARETPRAVVFDMDGVLVDSARFHARAWKEAFDDFLAEHDHDDRFIVPGDYRRYVDGRPRYEGVASFLESRGIVLSVGDPSDPPGMGSEAALGNLKNQIFHRLLDEEPIRPLAGVEDLLDGLRAEDTPVAVVSSSRNTDRILPSEVERRVDVVLGGKDLDDLGIPGKPQPDMFLRAADQLGFDPGEVTVVEDSPAGVVAGRRGGFSLVVGVEEEDRGSAVGELADVVVTGVSELPGSVAVWSGLLEPPPPALEHLGSIQGRIERGSTSLYIGDDEAELLSVRRADGVGVLVDSHPSEMTWADFYVPDEAAGAALRTRLDPGQPED